MEWKIDPYWSWWNSSLVDVVLEVLKVPYDWLDRIVSPSKVLAILLLLLLIAAVYGIAGRARAGWFNRFETLRDRLGPLSKSRIVFGLGLLVLIWWLATLRPLVLSTGLVLIAITVWTYRGVPEAGPRRISILVALRLLAILVAAVTVIRPSLGFHDDKQLPTSLLLLLDRSASMTIQDEIDGRSRWDHLNRILADAEPTLRKLREENQVTISTYGFAEDIGAFDPNSKPDGKRTDFGQALQSLYNLHGQDKSLRGLLILSDGADNGTRFQPMVEAAKWRRLPCPIEPFALGRTSTAERQRDIAFTDITAIPPVVAIKGKMTIKATLDAPGFETTNVLVRMFIDDKQVLEKKETLWKALKNEVTLVTDAPATRPKEGEVKVTLKVDPLPGEMTTANNEISTYVTITQEGISVLLVDRLRYPEPQRICDALGPDPRIRLYSAWLRKDKPTLEEEKFFQFEQQRYDVIILGDVSPERLAGGNRAIFDTIKKLVVENGTGLMMMGGKDSFGRRWRDTPLRDLLPVNLDADSQVDSPIKMEPTDAGFGRYLMRLNEKPELNRALWQKLPELNGMTRLGTKKGEALVLAVQSGTTEPVLVSMDIGKGRTLAFAGDTTWRWEILGQPKSTEGLEAHARFWKQVVLWLAHQDEAEGNVWIKPDRRRLDAGEKLGFTVGLRGKGGVEASEAHFDVKVIDPKGNEVGVATAQEASTERGTFWKTDLPGEYRLVVRGWGKDAEGQPIPEGTATSRFLVYENEAEMARPAADHLFLTKLAGAGGGKFHKAEELTKFLKELQKSPLHQAKPKIDTWPDWRSKTLSGFRVGFFLLFVGLLCLEWFLRRHWGMV
jgi:uncharacterized membrane protein